MIIIDDLKLNKFRLVAVPDNRSIFSRFGESVPLSSQFSGDEDIPENQSKIDTLRAADRDYNKFLKDNPDLHD